MAQPHFLPWVGYLELVSDSDVFVFLDSFQLSRQSWSTRNRILLRDGRVSWLSIELDHACPVGTSFVESKEHPERRWRTKVRDKIVGNYKRAPYFLELMEVLDPWLAADHTSIAETHFDLLNRILKRIGVETQIVRSSSLKIKSISRSERLRELITQVGGTSYLASAGSAEYMRQDGGWGEIQVWLQNHDPIPYRQVSSTNFVGRLAFIDAVANIGWDDLPSLVKGTSKWSPLFPNPEVSH